MKKVRRIRSLSGGDLFSSQTLSELKFSAGDRSCFPGRNVTRSREDRREDRREDGREDGREDRREDGREDRREDGRCSVYSCDIFFLM